MTRKEREYYSKAKPLAVMGITNNCGLAILEMQHGIDDYVVVKSFTGGFYRCNEDPVRQACAYVCGINNKKGE